jgi:hypothetical protein
VHNGFRDYCAACGRYVQSDPIGLAGGVSTFAYVGNDPLSHIDPLGLCDNEADRCKQVKEDAIELCSETLPNPRMDQSWTFQNCVAKYIEDHGCGPGGTPLPQPQETPFAIPPPNKTAVQNAVEVGALVLAALAATAYALSP